MTVRRETLEETIVAVATPPGEGGIGVVRISGPRAIEVADRIFQAGSGKSVQSQKSHTARFGHVVERSASRPAVDEALLLLMRAPKSYTGEDTAEISTHGGQAVLEAVVRLALGAGARLAEPGEFTKRAFLNGRMDLLQAEAVLDLIQARTERARQWASSQLEGSLSRKMKAWKDELVDVLSHLEASVDFPDDSPETEPLKKIKERLERLRADAERLLKDSELAFLAKRGLSVALWGRPNVGKSSLLNRLTRKDRVIVTPYPGTTRDVVEEETSLKGFPVRFLDTAGVRDTEHPIEKEGVGRSKKAMGASDLVLLVLDSSEPLARGEEALFEELNGKAVCVALNKSDLPRRLDPESLHLPASWPVIPCSCVKEGGLEALETWIFSFITGGRAEIPQDALLTNARQRLLLEKVSNELTCAAEGCARDLSPELIASDVREALDQLGEMVGEVFNDTILDKLFQQFCIGK